MSRYGERSQGLTIFVVGSLVALVETKAETFCGWPKPPGAHFLTPLLSTSTHTCQNRDYSHPPLVLSLF